MPAGGCGCTEQHMHIHEKRACRAYEKVFSFSRNGRLSEKHRAVYKERGGSSSLVFRLCDTKSREERNTLAGRRRKRANSSFYEIKRRQKGEEWSGRTAGGHDVKLHSSPQVKNTQCYTGECFREPGLPIQEELPSKNFTEQRAVFFWQQALRAFRSRRKHNICLCLQGPVTPQQPSGHSSATSPAGGASGWVGRQARAQARGTEGNRRRQKQPRLRLRLGRRKEVERQPVCVCLCVCTSECHTGSLQFL